MIVFMINEEDQPTVADIYKCKKQDYYDFAISHTHDADAALDIVQDAFMVFIDKFEDRRTLSRKQMESYIMGIVKHKCYAEYRRGKREYLVENLDWVEDDAADIDNITSSHYDHEALHEAMDRLPTRSYEYLILSVAIEEFAQAIREHWGIENQLHWCLDVAFREDASRARRDNSPLNLNVMRKNALSLLKSADWGRIGLRKKMFRAAMSSAALEYVLTGIK